MKLVLMLTDGQDAIWSVSKDASRDLQIRMERGNYEMGLLAAEDQLIQEAKGLKQKLSKSKVIKEK